MKEDTKKLIDDFSRKLFKINSCSMLAVHIKEDKGKLKDGQILLS